MERFLGAVTTAAPAPGLQLLLDTHDLRGRELLLQAVLGRLQGHPRQQRSRRSGSSAPPPQHDARTAAGGQQQPVVLVCSELAVAVDGPLAAVLAHPAASRLLHILDASSDPLGWDVAAPPSAPAAAGTSCAALAVTSLPALAAAATAAATPRGGPRPAVVFDSLTPWLRRHPLHSVCKVLRQIAQHDNVGEVLAIVHCDLHEAHEVAALLHVASSSLTLRPVPKELSHSANGLSMQFRIAAPGVEFSSYSPKDPLASLQPAPPTSAISSQAPFAEALPFRTTRSAREEAAKASTALPFHYSEERKQEHLATAAGSSLIFYEPDEGDDVDADDPDDDLNI